MKFFQTFLLLVLSIVSLQAAALNTNLIRGGTAESSNDLNEWTLIVDKSDGVMKRANYDTGWVENPPADGGDYFFYATGGDTYAYQTIDVSNLADDIDKGYIKYYFSAYMGGYGDGDTINITFDFLDENGNEKGSYSTGDVTSDKILELYTFSDDLPPGTRTVKVTLAFKRNSGTDTDGYFDNLAFALETKAVYAQDDVFKTTPDNALIANILANDFGDGIHVVDHTDPSHGTLSISSDGNITYNANPGYIGTDEFIYTIANADGTIEDNATVTITVTTQFTEGDNLPFYLINPPDTRNLIGNYAIAGNTVLCLTEKTDGYGGTCHDDDYQYITSNMHVVKYLDIDDDDTTWDSTSSYVEIPDTYNADIGIKWAGLFWQGRISVDKEHEIHYGVEESGGYDFVEVGKGTTISIDDFDIRNTGAVDIKLKVNNGPYEDATAATFHVFESNNGQTYAAYANVTELVRKANIQPGKNTFTVANLTTMEGREESPGAFGGWALVIIYAEKKNGYDDQDVSAKNISVYNGFISIGRDDDPIHISGFKLPASNDVESYLSIFSGEGEYRYGRTPYSDTEDWLKMSDHDGDYEYLPGLSAGTDVGNRNNMFDATLANILRDSIPGKYNDLQINNVGVDVDYYDVSELMSRYRDNNPNISEVYLKTYSNNDYITPSMMIFSTQLYEPSICYDYTFDIGGYVLDSYNNDVNTTVHLAAPEQPLRTHILIRSMEGDFNFYNSEFSAKVTNPDMLTYIPESTAISQNGVNVYETVGPPQEHDVSNDGFRLYIGEGAGSSGGIIRPNQNYYIRFDYDTNTSQPKLSTSFSFDINFTVDYGSGPLEIYKHLDENSRCPVSYVYEPEWGLFNIISDPDNLTYYGLSTQVTNRAFEVYAVYYTGENYDVPTELNSTGTSYLEVELINANYFKSDTNASCLNPDSNITTPIFAKFTANSAVSQPISVGTDSGSSTFNIPVDFALRNSAFRMWYLTDENGHLVQYECTSRADHECFESLLHNQFGETGEELCGEACAANNTNNTACYECLRKYFGKPLCSRDNFSIRPKTFNIVIEDFNDNIATTGFSILSNSTTNGVTPLAADYNYSLTVQALDFSESYSARHYVQGFGAKADAGSIEENMTILGLQSNFPNTYVCPNDLNRSYGMTTWDGTGINRNFAQNDVGDYLLKIRDSSWTKVDNPGKYGQDCIPYPSSGYDSVPSTGLVGCIISSNLTGSHYDQAITFNPYGFDLSTVTLSAPNDDFVYMNDLRSTDDTKMAIMASGFIKAVGKHGTLLSNFTDQCYAKDLNLTFAAVSLPAAPIVKQRFLDTVSNENNTIDVDPVDDIVKARFSTGQATLDTRINFDANRTTAVNPIDLNITSVDINCSQLSVCSSYADQSTLHIADGSIQPYFYRHFYYGRLHAPDYRTKSRSITTPIYAEVYADPASTSLNIYGITGWKESVDDVNWWINPLHNGSKDGNISSLTAKEGFSDVIDTAINIVQPTNAFANGADTTATISLAPNANPPHTTRIFINTQNWLRFHRFISDPNKQLYYDVTFLGSGNWAGIGKIDSNATVQESNGTSQRIEW